VYCLTDLGLFAWLCYILELLARDYEEFKVPDLNNDDIISYNEVGCHFFCRNISKLYNYMWIMLSTVVVCAACGELQERFSRRHRI
jgi:hypothetical protein